MAVCVGRQRLRYQITTALHGGLRMTACCVQLIFTKMIQELITKWEQKHSKLLEEYNLYTKLSENEALFLRSEMRQVVEIIEDLKKLNGVFGQL